MLDDKVPSPYRQRHSYVYLEETIKIGLLHVGISDEFVVVLKLTKHVGLRPLWTLLPYWYSVAWSNEEFERKTSLLQFPKKLLFLVKVRLNAYIIRLDLYIQVLDVLFQWAWQEQGVNVVGWQSEGVRQRPSSNREHMCHWPVHSEISSYCSD